MSLPGWYPDPADPGQLRRWDGQSWTHEVRPTGPSPAQPVRQRAGTPLWLWVVIGVVALALVVLVAIRGLGGPGGVPGIERPVDSSTPTVSGWDEGMPSASRTSTPDPASPRPVNCDPGVGQGVATGDDPVQVGPLSMPRPAPDWQGPEADRRMPLGRDGYGYRFVLPEEQNWQSSIFIGILADPGFASTQTTARTISQCLLTSGFYVSVEVAMEGYTEQAITIDGVGGTQADFLVRFDHPGLQTKGSALRVIILDSIPERTWFFAAVPMERDDHLAAMDAATAGLRVG